MLNSSWMDLKLIRRKIRKGEYDLSHHAHKERQIEKTVLKGDIIEEYPKDPRGPSCLVAIKNSHVVCGFREDRVLIVTVYRPQLPTWIDYKIRAKELKSRE